MGLRAYEVNSLNGNALRLKLYWTALEKPPLDYSSFAHVLRAPGQPDTPPLVQADQVPGIQIGYPPSRWAKGDLVLDERMILLSSPLPEGDYVIRLGVYNYTSGARLYVQPNSVSDDYVLLKFTVPHVN